MSNCEALMQEVFSAMTKGWLHSEPLFVFITGMDCSGKSHFANLLASYIEEEGFRVQLVHVDDFHNPRHIRYDKTMEPPVAYYERSFDHKKLINELLIPIRQSSKIDITLRLLNVDTDKMEVVRQFFVEPRSIVIVEGVFLLKSEFFQFRDFTIYVDASLETVLKRANVRDHARFDEEVEHHYLSKFIPAQIAYEALFKPVEIANIIINNEDYSNPTIKRISHSIGHIKQVDRQATSTLHIQNKSPNRKDRKFDAVIFDLWDTLVPLPSAAKQITRSETARILDLPLREFDELWHSTRHIRETSDLSDYLRDLCETLGKPNPARVISAIKEVRSRIHGACFLSPRANSAACLRLLRANGVATAILSNCTSDVEELMGKSALSGLANHLFLSAKLGFLKPDPDFYLAALSVLGVAAERCLYIGDGNDRELEGAKSVGLEAVLYKTDRDVQWEGASIGDLKEAVNLALNS
ncbi:FMN phosphatase YigB (HAD superfamily)/uridine kinase [Paraburkholderia sp. GAS206C]|uniref:HAD-IA family hydrolase n=1 Tax=unclassified Paraburkholderia TaxID=2615204 RepID=UPI003D202858